MSVQKAFRRWVQHGPLGAQHAAITPNPSLTVPTNYMSPRKKRESGLNSPSTSFQGMLPTCAGAGAAGAPADGASASPASLAAARLAMTPASALGATKRLRLPED